MLFALAPALAALTLIQQIDSTVSVEKGQRLPTGGYEVLHSTPVVGIDADDRVPIVWTEGTSAAEFAADVHSLLTGEVAA